MENKSNVISQESMVLNQNMKEKGRLWVGVMYPESMVPNWQEEIEDLIELPFVYIVHDKDVDSDGKPKKEHVHLIICFNSPTTRRNALSIFQKLGICNVIQRVINFNHKYAYLIHDTEKAKKQGKYQYPPEARISGNGFSYDHYIVDEISDVERRRIKRELVHLVREKQFFDFGQLCDYLEDNYDTVYQDVAYAATSLLYKRCEANYLQDLREKAKDRKDKQFELIEHELGILHCQVEALLDSKQKEEQE